MKVLLDTSTLIAAMLPDHVRHGPISTSGLPAAIGFALVGSAAVGVTWALTQPVDLQGTRGQYPVAPGSETQPAAKRRTASGSNIS